MSARAVGALRRRGARAVLAAAGALALGAVLAAGPPALAAGAALDARARLPDGPGASEQWDLVAELASGHRITARFMITNLGPGERNGAVLGHVRFPDGRLEEFRNGRRSDEWELLREGRELVMGHSRLDLDAPRPDGSRGYRLDVTKDRIQVDVPFAPRAAAVIAAPGTPAAYHSELLASGAPTRARFFVPGGMAAPVESDGVVHLVHTWIAGDEVDHAVRRMELFGSEGGRTIYWSELLTPGGTRASWMQVVDAEGRAFSSVPPPLAESRPRPLEAGPGYALPGLLTASWDAGDVRIETGPIWLEVNPLVVLPAPFRWWIALTMRPYRVWAASDFHVTLRAGLEPPLVTSGTGVVVTTFTNPVNRSHETPSKP